MDLCNRPLRVLPDQIRRQLANAGLVDIQETMFRMQANPWADEEYGNQLGRTHTIQDFIKIYAKNNYSIMRIMTKQLGCSKRELVRPCDFNAQIYCYFCISYVTLRRIGLSSGQTRPLTIEEAQTDLSRVLLKFVSFL